MKTKICKECKIEYPLNDFWRIPNSPDGYDRNCKVCRKKIVKKRNLENGIMDLSHVRFNQLRDEDHYHSYKLLERLGYELESDKSIHEQFCEKYGLEIKKRDKPHRPYKSWNQCKKNPQ